MRVSVDEHKCIGSGQCVVAAEEVFDQRDDGIVILLDQTPAAELHDDVRQAAEICPALAIMLTES